MPLVGKAQSAIRAHHDVTRLLAHAKENRGRPPFRSATKNRSHSSIDGCFSSIPATPTPYVDPTRFEAILRHHDVTANDSALPADCTARPPFRSSSRHAGIPSREYSCESTERDEPVGGTEVPSRHHHDSGGPFLLQEREVSVCSRRDTPLIREVQSVTATIHASCARRYEEMPQPRAMRLQLRAPFRPSLPAEQRPYDLLVKPMSPSSLRKQTPRRRFASAEVFLRVAPGTFCASGIPPKALEQVLSFIPDSVVPLASNMSSACQKLLKSRMTGAPKNLPSDIVYNTRSESSSSHNASEPSIGYWSALASYASSAPSQVIPRAAKCAMLVAAAIVQGDAGVGVDDDLVRVARVIREALHRDAAKALEQLSCSTPMPPPVVAALREFLVREMRPFRSVQSWTETFDAVDATAANFLRTVAAAIELVTL